jgi:hypothetical protein
MISILISVVCLGTVCNTSCNGSEKARRHTKDSDSRPLKGNWHKDDRMYYASGVWS